MGFMNNDVIEEINGYQLNDPAGAVKFLNTLRSEKEVEIRYRRNGSAVNKVVHLQ
jgi:type II secretory pathway component PulC